MSDEIIIVGLIILAVLFGGEPDLQDVIVARLMPAVFLGEAP